MSTVGAVLSAVGPEVSRIFVVDDKCPDETGKFVEKSIRDPRITVLYNSENLGVGGAVMTGYRSVMEDPSLCRAVVVKVDADGQMDPRLVSSLVRPIVEGRADYVKGNRFFSLDDLRAMPYMRLFGNSGLSFVNKVASGYWSVMDPTNGFTAIHVKVLRLLPLDKIAKRFFFESDMLFRLGCVRAVVKDFPMAAVYGGEVSNLRIRKIMWEFPGKYLKALLKRIFYRYYLRDFSVGSIQLLVGMPLFLFGVIFGVAKWIEGVRTGVLTPTGTIFLAALPVLLGLQLLLSALSIDILQEPSDPLHPTL